jgi:peroxiredoxin
MPALDELYRQSVDRGLVVLAVTDDDVAAVREYAQKNRYSFPIVLDPERRSFEQYRVAGYPSSIIIDREGGIAAVFMGARSRVGFGRAVERAGL